MKALIEKNTWSGIEEYYRHMGESRDLHPASSGTRCPDLFVSLLLITTFIFHAESEVCKLETLLQNEVSVVAAGESVGADAAKTPPSLRRRKRACSRRQGDKEKEREGGGSGPGERGDRGVGEERDHREAGESWTQTLHLAILCAMLPSSGQSGNCTK